MPNVASEIQIAERFAVWLSATTGQSHTVTPGLNPPDFLMEPQTWLEVSDIYLSNEQAKFLNSPDEKSFGFHGSPDEPALRLLQKLNEKLSKTSYRTVYDQRGSGILLLTCQDCFFDEVNFARVYEALASFRPTNDQGFFHTAYFEYRLPADERIYDIIYPAKGLNQPRQPTAGRRTASLYVMKTPPLQATLALASGS
jgi:hypothetical protein